MHNTNLAKLYQHDSKHAVILMNLGTPAKPTFWSVYKFLSKFLSDKRVIPLPKLLWWPLLHFVILPLRCGKVSKKYKMIWGQDNSPMLAHMQSIATKLSEQDPKNDYYMAMRYSAPYTNSIIQQITKHSYEKITILPLYPQYSDTTSGSSLFAVIDALKKQKYTPSLRFIHDFCNHPTYIDALTNSIKEHWSTHNQSEYLVISFHGLPADSFSKGDPYRLCCMETATALSKRLEQVQPNIKIVFQSRFGPKKWLQPYAEDVIKSLALQGVKTIDVIAPSFYCDCLETLEEISEGYKELFEENGGKALHYIPSLNDSARSIELLLKLVNHNN